MKQLSVACLFLISFFLAATVYAQSLSDDCAGSVEVNGKMECVDVSNELGHVRSFFDGSNGVLLATTQALIGVEPDGKWGPNTARSFQRTLETYIVIGGRGSDWGVNKKNDTERLVRWIATAEYATATGGEFPD
jgi:hypothetical protein